MPRRLPRATRRRDDEKLIVADAAERDGRRRPSVGADAMA